MIRVALLRDPLGNLHHQAAHDYREQLLGTVVAELFLQLCKRYCVHSHRARVAADLLQQLYDLLLSPRAGVGRTCEVNGGELYSALCHCVD